MRIGRDPACDVVIDDREVSRDHALVAFADGRWLIQDLGSGNGTFVDDRTVTGRVELRTGQVIRVAEHRFAVIIDEPTGPETIIRRNNAVGEETIVRHRTNEVAAAPPGAATNRGLSAPRRIYVGIFVVYLAIAFLLRAGMAAGHISISAELQNLVSLLALVTFMISTTWCGIKTGMHPRWSTALGVLVVAGPLFWVSFFMVVLGRPAFMFKTTATAPQSAPRDTTLKYSRWAIASLILGTLAVDTYSLGVFPIAGLVTSIVALDDFDPARHRGRWMAVAGLVLSILYTLMYLFYAGGPWSASPNDEATSVRVDASRPWAPDGVDQERATGLAFEREDQVRSRVRPSYAI